MTAPPTRRRRRQRDDGSGPRGIVYRALRLALGTVSSLYAALGLLLITGALVVFAATWGFAELADEVGEGTVQPFDDAVLQWVADHRVPWLEAVFLELTVLGSGLVVLVMVGVAALFLSVGHRYYSAILLLVATAGGLVITQLLKIGFARPRPQLVEWADHVITASFPSGHTTSAAVAYGTIAYLIARIHHNAAVRWIIMVVAAILVALVAISRVYLGVHYPSDVLAGLLLGLAWAAFCMTALGAIQRVGRRRSDRRAGADEAPEAQTLENTSRQAR